MGASGYELLHREASRQGAFSPMTLEDALNELYQGRTNVAIQAALICMPKTDLQRVFADYVSSRGLDEDIWQKDVELSWPYIT